MSKKTLFLLLLLFPILGFSQRKGIPKSKEKEEIEDTKFFAYGASTNTNSGILGGFVLRHSKAINIKEARAINRYVALELINVKHPKENTTFNNFGNKVSLGKKNYLFAVRPEFGREWFMFTKNGDEGIGLSGILAAGPTIGIEKPYYIRYVDPNQDQPSTVPYDPNIHTDISRIVGSGSIWQGLFKGAKVAPGVHIKSALNLDMNTFGDNITGIEFGFTMEYYFKKPEIMAQSLIDNKTLYTSGFITLYFGNKRIKK